MSSIQAVFSYRNLSLLIAVSGILISTTNAAVTVTFSSANGGNDTNMTWSGSFTHDVITSTSPINSDQQNFSGTSAFVLISPGYSTFLGSSNITTDATAGVYGNIDHSDFSNISGQSFGKSGASFLWGTDDSTDTISGSITFNNLSVGNFESTEWSVDSTSTTSVHFTAVPEPSTYVSITGVAVLGIVLYQRRNKQRKAA